MVFFHSFTWSCPVVPTFSKEIFFLIVHSCLSCNRSIDHICMGLFPGSLSCLLISVSIFVLVLFCFDFCGLVAYSENREQNASSSTLLSQDCFNYWIQENMQTFLHGLQYFQNVKENTSASQRRPMS